MAPTRHDHDQIIVDRLVQLAHYASEAGEPMVECGCLAMIQILNLDRHKRRLMAHVFMDLANVIREDGPKHVVVPTT